MTDLLGPFEPTVQRPWDRVAAAHLLRRAGFEPSEAEVRSALQQSPGEVVARLIRDTRESERHDELDQRGATLATRSNEIGPLRGWWLLRMRHTLRPLHARMALFWHNHFATSNAKVRSPGMMLQQLRTFERFGLGGFGQLLIEVSRDPAMIVWLDGEQNVRGRPNENYARELFELFSLGVGHYTERDIKEAARAFTGWHQRNGVFHYVPLEHDERPKSVLGRDDVQTGEDVVAAALAQPACAEFIATKLLHEFVTPRPTSELVAAVAGKLRETEYDLGATLETLLASAAFFDPAVRRTRIKSPAELAVGIARSLELRVPADAMSDAVAQMSQALFEPPSVKGWDGQRAWLNSATMLVRLNTATAAVALEGFDPGKLRDAYDLKSRDDVLDFATRLTLDGESPAGVKDALAAVSGALDEILRNSLGILMSSPEYQMS